MEELRLRLNQTQIIDNMREEDTETEIHNLTIDYLVETQIYTPSSTSTTQLTFPTGPNKGNGRKYSLKQTKKSTKGRIQILPHFPVPKSMGSKFIKSSFIQNLNMAKEVHFMNIKKTQKALNKTIGDWNRSPYKGDIGAVPQVPELPNEVPRYSISNLEMQFPNLNLNFQQSHSLKLQQMCKSKSRCPEWLGGKASNLTTLANLSDQNIYLKDKRVSKKTNKTLILDLDETLIHTISDDEMDQFDQKKIDRRKVKANYTKTEEEIFYIRPGLIDFLKYVSKRFECILFTAAGSSYTQRILTEIDPKKEYFDHILTRAHCRRVWTSRTEITLRKGLDRINRDPSHVIVVDDVADNWRDDFENLIIAKPYYGEKKDKELYKIRAMLNKLSFVQDVREENRRLILKLSPGKK